MSDDKRANTRRVLAFAAAGYAFAGGLVIAGVALFIPEAGRVETALPIYLAGLTPAGALLGYYKGKDGA